jgi:molybdenum cofactor biosynthesis enzyme MoaA
MSATIKTLWLRGIIVDAVDKLIPKRLLKLLIHPKFHEFVGLDRIEAIGIWIDNNFMLKRRQKMTAEQQTRPSTKDYLKRHFCAAPFEQLETQPTGLAYVCCPIWLPTPIGTLDTEPNALWNSETAKKLRESIIDGSFRYCNHVHCPEIAGRTLMPRSAPHAQELIARYESDVPTLPMHVKLSHDKSCNISCPSCRATTYLANSTKQAKLDRLTETTLLPLLRRAKSVLVTGSGDPFGSKHFRNLLKRLTSKEFPGLEIDLISNGQLLDSRAWVELGLKNKVRNVEISIDAARPETYAIVRRGGSFERLLTNLAFLRDLRRSGEIAHLRYSMVVQALNYKEMPAFVHLCEAYAADLVYFNMIRQRDIFSKDEYTISFIGSPQHPEYEQFLEVLEAPELAQPNVIIGNVREYARPRTRQTIAVVPPKGVTGARCSNI